MALNFPTKKRVETKKVVNKANLGMDLEGLINESNEYYLVNDYAVIHKKPTPVQIVKVDYPMRSKAVITEAYYKTPSTTDYNGIYRGKYIDYEAKETNNLSFDFKHIFEHQVEHLHKVALMGGIAFVIIYFKKVDEIYITDINKFYELWTSGKKDGRRSIKLETFKEIGALVPRSYTPPVDYLKAVDEIYFK